MHVMCVRCRDQFIICPTLQMANHYAKNGANVFLYHQPASANRCQVLSTAIPDCI